MCPFPVIKDLDVLKKTLPKFLLVTEFFSVDPLGFQCLEKYFRYGIIIAVSFPAGSEVYNLLRNRCTLYSEIRCTLCSEIFNRQILPTGRGRDVRVSRPGELHPQPLSELYVNVSAHTAPIIQPLVHIQVASERIRSESFEPVYRELFLLGSYAQLNACTFASTNASNTYSCDPI